MSPNLQVCSICYRMWSQKLKAFPCSYLPGCSPLPTPGSYGKPHYQKSQLPKLLVLVLCVGLSGPIPEVEKVSGLGESLVSPLVLLACNDQMNHPEPVAWSQAYSISFNPHTFNKPSIVNTLDRKRLNNSATSEFHSRFPVSRGAPSYNNPSFSLQMERL